MSQRVEQKPTRSRPPRWLLVVLAACVALLLLFVLTRGGGDAGQAAESGPEPTVSALPAPTPTPEPTPTPTPTPTPAPEPDYTQPVPLGEKVEMDWFADAVFIGDSRTDGFQLYSGISGGDFLDYTGITAFDVIEGKKVIREGKEKISVLEALGRKTYGKVYISLGVNELGYFNAERFASTYGQIIDAVRELQPDAALYIQSIIPVNTAKCKANGIPYYVTNEGITSYNAALAQLAAEKKVSFLNVSEALVDETGEVPREDSADGVHFQKSGYIKWLDYLTTHTGVQN
ncbi:MAG: GDSL-type esterase/lipase family protein [Lachnospirales bacterium]